MTKKRLKVGQAMLPPASKPQCSTHNVEMGFVPENMRWECRNPECTKVAYPKQDTDRPTLGKGNLELVVLKDEYGIDHTFIRADNNVMLKVDENITSTKDYGSLVSLTLSFGRVTKDSMEQLTKARRGR